MCQCLLGHLGVQVRLASCYLCCSRCSTMLGTLQLPNSAHILKGGEEGA